MEKACLNFKELVNTVTTLLDEEKGCPWDRHQTHETLTGYLAEESAELKQAFEKNDWANVEEELGDVLFVILFHCALAQKEGRFNLASVIEGINTKLIRRHPHIFSHCKNMTPEEIKKQWDEIKKQEKATKKTK